MKKIYVLLIALLILSTPLISNSSYAQQSKVEIVEFSYRDYYINWGAKFKITLKNIGRTLIDNIDLKIEYKAVNGKLVLYDIISTNWDDVLNTNEKTTKYWKYDLPVGYRIDNATLKIDY